jgi:hypothetical protein
VLLDDVDGTCSSSGSSARGHKGAASKLLRPQYTQAAWCRGTAGCSAGSTICKVPHHDTAFNLKRGHLNSPAHPSAPTWHQSRAVPPTASVTLQLNSQIHEPFTPPAQPGALASNPYCANSSRRYSANSRKSILHHLSTHRSAPRWRRSRTVPATAASANATHIHTLPFHPSSSPECTQMASKPYCANSSGKCKCNTHTYIALSPQQLTRVHPDGVKAVLCQQQRQVQMQYTYIHCPFTPAAHPSAPRWRRSRTAP